jgi:hypothetical protein
LYLAEIFNVIIIFDHDFDDLAAYNIEVSVNGSTFYFDGEGGLTTDSTITYTKSDWKTDIGGYPRATVVGLDTRNCTVTASTASITLDSPDYVPSTKIMTWTRPSFRTRWEVRGVTLDYCYDGIYRDLAELLGFWDENGNHSYQGLLDVIKTDLESRRNSTFSSSGNVTTNMETLLEKAGNPLFMRLS